MPFGPNWTARLLVSDRTAPLDAVYASCGTVAADERDEARDVDDRAAAALDHVRDGVLAAEEHAADVDGHDLVPGVDVGVDDRVVGGRHDPGVVVEHVQAAIRVDRRVDHRLGVGLPGNVGGDSDRLAAGVAYLPGGVLGGLRADVGQHQARALGREHPGRDPAHPAARAGDDRDLVLEPHTAPPIV